MKNLLMTKSIVISCQQR